MRNNAGTWVQENANLKDEVYKKLETEFNLYKEWLLCKPKEEMLTYANEYALREEILGVFDDGEFTDEELAKLGKANGLLGKILALRRKDTCCNAMRREILDDDIRQVLKGL